MRRGGQTTTILLALQAFSVLSTVQASGGEELPFRPPNQRMIVDADKAAVIKANLSNDRPAKLKKANLDIKVLWDLFRTRLIDEAGRVTDNANGGISHSEGQGYGMLIAAKLGDRTTFDKLWEWTKVNLFIREDGLAAWRWEPDASPHVTDTNNASDGDLLIAWALVEAEHKWPQSAYGEEARQLGLAIMQHVTADVGDDLVIMPGVFGFQHTDREDGPVVNPSYWVFPALSALKEVLPDLDWDRLTESGLSVIRRGGSGPFDLPSDWLSLKQSQPQPAEGFPQTFGYNGIRIPLYLAAAGIGDDEILGRFKGLWNPEENVGPFSIDVSTGMPVETLGGTGFQAIAALADCAVTSRPVPETLFETYDQNYYPAALQILALLTIQEIYPKCL